MESSSSAEDNFDEIMVQMMNIMHKDEIKEKVSEIREKAKNKQDTISRILQLVDNVRAQFGLQPEPQRELLNAIDPVKLYILLHMSKGICSQPQGVAMLVQGKDSDPISKKLLGVLGAGLQKWAGEIRSSDPVVVEQYALEIIAEKQLEAEGPNNQMAKLKQEARRHMEEMKRKDKKSSDEVDLEEPQQIKDKTMKNQVIDKVYEMRLKARDKNETIRQIMQIVDSIRDRAKFGPEPQRQLMDRIDPIQLYILLQMTKGICSKSSGVAMLLEGDETDSTVDKLLGVLVSGLRTWQVEIKTNNPAAVQQYALEKLAQAEFEATGSMADSQVEMLRNAKQKQTDLIEQQIAPIRNKAKDKSRTMKKLLALVNSARASAGLPPDSFASKLEFVEPIMLYILYSMAKVLKHPQGRKEMIDPNESTLVKLMGVVQKGYEHTWAEMAESHDQDDVERVALLIIRREEMDETDEDDE